MQERFYVGLPTFSLAPQWYPHFFNSRIATDQKLKMTKFIKRKAQESGSVS